MAKILIVAAVLVVALGGNAAGVLPEGYAELLWLESTGTQFIDTGVVFADTNGLSVTYQNMSKGLYGGNSIVCGSRVDTGDTRMLVGSNTYLSTNTYAYVGWNSVREGWVAEDHERGTVWVNYENDRMIHDRAFRHVAIPDALTPQTSTFYLFAGNLSYSDTPGFGGSRIMNFRMTAGKSLVMNLVPARREADGELGMYDLVGGRFLVNGGTGAFVAGPAMPSGAVAYIPLDYLESSQARMMIDTGVRFTDRHGYSITYQNVASTGNDNVCGSRESSGDTRCVLGGNGGFAYVGWNSLVVQSAWRIPETSVGTVKVNYRNSRTVDCRGTKASLAGNVLTPQPGTFWLFAGHYPYSGQSNVFSSYRIFDFEMTEGEATVMHLRPVRRKIDWQTGLYDAVNDRFYPCGATCNFAVPKPVLPENLAEVDYLESDGNAYIDTGVKNTSAVRSEVTLYLAANASSVHLFGARAAFESKAHGLSFQTESQVPGYAIAWGGEIRYGVSLLGADLTTAVGDAFHTFTLGDRYHWIDGKSTAHDFPVTSYATDLNLYAFALNNGGTPHAQRAQSRISLLHITEGGATVRHLQPVINTNTCALGLYDWVNGRFYGNAGTGAFRFGNFVRGFTGANALAKIGSFPVDNPLALTSGAMANLAFRAHGGRYRLIFKHGCSGSAPTVNVSLDGTRVASITPTTSQGRLTANCDVTLPNGAHTLTFEGIGTGAGTASLCDIYLYQLQSIPSGMTLLIR